MWYAVCGMRYANAACSLSSCSKFVKESQSSCLLYFIRVQVRTDQCMEGSTFRIHIHIWTYESAIVCIHAFSICCCIHTHMPHNGILALTLSDMCESAICVIRHTFCIGIHIGIHIRIRIHTNWSIE